MEIGITLTCLQVESIVVRTMCGLSPGLQVDSMREAMFIASPKTLNLGSLVPMRPVTTGPVWRPMRTTVGSPVWGIMTALAQRSMACMAVRGGGIITALAQRRMACNSVRGGTQATRIWATFS